MTGFSVAPVALVSLVSPVTLVSPVPPTKNYRAPYGAR